MSAFLRGAIEAVVLALVCLSPWALGGVEPGTEFCLLCGVAFALFLWSLRCLLDGVSIWTFCPVSLGLAGLFLFGVFQLAPLPPSILGWISPQTARLDSELLPAIPEVLPFGEIREECPLRAGSSISLHPAATRLEVIRLLAVFLLFAVVRNNITSPAATRRLAIVALANGAFLALFAFIQFFSSPPNTIYWTFRVLGNPFGPFINRDHFSFYLNMCIGLGGGLLLCVLTQGKGREAGRRGSRSRKRSGQGPEQVSRDALSYSPAALWIGVALAFALSGVFFSLSRGAFLSFFASLGILLLPRVSHASWASRLAGLFLVLVLTSLLLAWFGFAPLVERISTLWKMDPLADGRMTVWADVLPGVKDYPLWGTGYGTFLYVEQMWRSRLRAADLGWGNAHNDYVEALVEGGVVRLVLSLLVIALVYRLGWRALRRLEGHKDQGLVIGALFAFTTVVLHSFVDFGLHIQAITVLATVLSAHLVALGGRVESHHAALVPEKPAQTTKESWTGRALGAVAVVVALALGVVLCTEGWRLARTYALEVAAREHDGSVESDQQEARVALLEQASRVAPEKASLRLSAGQAYWDRYQAEEAKLDQQQQLRDILRLLLALPALPGLPPYQGMLAAFPSCRLIDSSPPFRTVDEEGKLVRRYLVPSLRHYLVARDLCPLMAKPQIRIADLREWLDEGDARSAFIRRAKQTLPSNPEVWYLAGRLELRDGLTDEAWSSWRQSLQISQQYLPEILEMVRTRLTDEALIQQVLPARAEIQLAAAAYLHPQPDDEERRPFLKSARRILSESSEKLSAGEFRRWGQIETSLGDNAAAINAYEAALSIEPREAAWRYEYAVLLYKEGRLKDARREALLLLGWKPGDPAALRLLEKMARGNRGKE